MVLGHLRSISEGLHIQREPVRKCLARVDPRNVRIRWAITVSIRAYSVAGPNSLWHFAIQLFINDVTETGQVGKAKLETLR